MLQEEKEFEKLCRNQKSHRVTVMLKEVIRKQYPQRTCIDLNDLLQWNLWPCLLKAFGMFLYKSPTELKHFPGVLNTFIVCIHKFV